MGIFLAEFSFDGAQKIPFACSYLPGRSHIHVTFLLWLYVVGIVVVGAAVGERDALERPAKITAIVATLAAAAAISMVQNNRLARPSQAELRFEEVPPGQLVRLELS
jgi:hypothetical protein